MTALAHRRRRNTLVAAVLAAVAVVFVVGITAVGASSLVNSRAGRDASAGRLPQVEVPATPLALVAAVDDDGELASLAVLVVAPNGVGGSIVAIPATADSSLHLGPDRYPLDETLEVEGVERFVLEAEAMTALSFDVVELVTAERLVELIGPLGTIEVDLPVDVPLDADAVEILAAGPTTMSVVEAAALLTMPNPIGPGRALDPARSAVWAGIAERIGAGLGTSEPVPDGTDVPTPASLDELVQRLLAGRVGFRSMLAEVPEADRNPRGVDVVVVDRAELLLVFGQIAPGRVAAPNESLTFRIEASFSDAELEPFGINNADVARDVINRLLYVQANVVSVVTDGPDGAPDVSQAAVAETSLLNSVEEGWTVLLGDVEVSPADYQIVGVDATIVLGRSYLELRQLEVVTGITVPGGLTEPTELGATDDDDDPIDDPADDEDGS